MDNPGSSIISALGAGSGVDFGRLAQDISAASFAFQRETITNRRDTLEARISAAAQLRSAMSGLASALGDRIRGGDLAPQATISNPAVARPTVPVGLSPRGAYALEVTALAQGQTWVGGAYASGAATVGAGTLTIRFGTVSGSSFAADAARAPITLTVGPEETLAGLAARLNRDSGGAISAYVANGTGGAQLVMKGAEGANAGFVIEAESAAASPASVPGDLAFLAWTPESDVGQSRSTARDAAFTLDGVAMTSPTNRVTGLPEGIGLELTGTNPGAPTRLAFESNRGAITTVMTDLVSALNEIAGELTTVANPLGGELGNDAGARELRRDLAALAGQVLMPGTAPGDPRTFADLGLVLTREGGFRLDSARLARTLEARPEATAAMFTLSASGVFAGLDRLARDNALVGDPGSLGGSLRRYEAERARVDERLERIAEQQEELRERLSLSFIASERRVAASQSTLAFLRQQVATWNAREEG